MENGQKSISDLFETRRIFNIPKYQRAYAWENKQLQDFINDLDTQNLGKDYFFGTILLQVCESEGPFKIIDIVDGQQRITTLSIFMRLLLNKLESFGDDVSILKETYVQYRNEYKLRVLEYDQEFFEKYILEDNDATENQIETPSQRRLLNAKLFLNKQLEKRTAENLRELKEKIENAKVLTYAVLNNAEATLIFETTNDRGKALTSLEKIKSFLMYKVYIAADDPEGELSKIQERFGNIYRQYEEMSVRLTIEETAILKNHYITFEFNIQPNTNDYTHHLYFIKNKVNSLTIKPTNFKEATQFIDDYSYRLAKSFITMNNLSKQLDGDFLNLFYLKRVTNFWPLLMVSLKHDPTLKKFKRITKLLEIISFRVYGIRKRKTNNKSILKRLYELAQTFQGDFENLIICLKDLISEFCSDREFKQRLLSPDFYENISSTDLNYLFWQYENYLRLTEYSPNTQIGFREYSGLSIEHIIPQNPRELTDWMDETFWNKYVNSIGNLTLDLSWENRGKSNLDFNTKYRYFFCRSRFCCQREIKNFTNVSTGEWDLVSIDTRTRKLVDFAMMYWDYRDI